MTSECKVPMFSSKSTRFFKFVMSVFFTTLFTAFRVTTTTPLCHICSPREDQCVWLQVAGPWVQRERTCREKRENRDQKQDSFMEVLKSPIQALIPPSVLLIDELSQFVGLMVFTRAKGKDKLSAFTQVIMIKRHSEILVDTESIVYFPPHSYHICQICTLISRTSANSSLQHQGK